MKKIVNIILIGVGSGLLSACVIDEGPAYQPDYTSSSGYVSTYHSNRVTSGYNRNYQSQTGQQQTTYSNAQTPPTGSGYSSSISQQNAPIITSNTPVSPPPEVMSSSGYRSSGSQG